MRLKDVATYLRYVYNMYIYPDIDPVVAMYTDHPFLCWAAFPPHFSLSIHLFSNLSVVHFSLQKPLRAKG